MRLNVWKTNPNRSRRRSDLSFSDSASAVAALDANLSGVRTIEKAEEIQQRRLSRAARALERDELSRSDCERDVPHGRDPGGAEDVRAGDAVGLDERPGRVGAHGHRESSVSDCGAMLVVSAPQKRGATQ